MKNVRSIGLACFALTVSAGAADVSRATFRPGELWPDDRGVHLNAHGGGILLHEGTYYWYVWLPVEWEADRPVLRWHGEWDLSVFKK